MTLSELATEVGIDAMAAVIHETAVSKGFWPDKYYGEDDRWGHGKSGIHASLPKREITHEAISTKLALVHSEVTEVLEAVRKNQGKDAIVEEMADIIIRTLDLYAGLKNTGQVDASLEDVLQLKMKKNELRPHKHGNNF